MEPPRFLLISVPGHNVRHNEAPSRPFSPECGMNLWYLRKYSKNILFAKIEIQLGLGTGISTRVSQEYAQKSMVDCSIISSVFTARHGSGEKRKGIFFMNFSRVSKHWPKGSVGLTGSASFAMNPQRGRLSTVDKRGEGNRHLRFDPDMRK